MVNIQTHDSKEESECLTLNFFMIVLLRFYVYIFFMEYYCTTVFLILWQKLVYEIDLIYIGPTTMS